jgi:RNA polymerase sigma factor (sigma-70 family)
VTKLHRSSPDPAATAKARITVETEEQLFEAVRAGDSGAWDRLVGRYAALVLSVPRKMGLDAADCDEVFQATWITLHQHGKLIRKPSSLPSWIITTARREAWRLERARRRRANVEEEGMELRPVTAESLPPEELERLELIQLVRDGVRSLPERCRVLLERLELAADKPSYEELAEEMGIPVGSVGPTRMRCLARLARRLKGQL